LKLNWFTTIYLAPHNYHRVHCPIDGSLKKIRYFPGKLWPVNPPFLKSIPRLFVKNERLVFEIVVPEGGTVFVVMVGALNVGRMQTPFVPDFFTNSIHRQFGALRQEHNLSILTSGVGIGCELGGFMLGSTVVVVFDDIIASRFQICQTSKSRQIKMGESLLID